MIFPYFKVPQKAKFLFLDHWCDDQDDLYQIKVKAETEDNVLLVWESDKFPSYKMQNLKEETETACRHYGITPKFGNDFWEWKGFAEIN